MLEIIAIDTASLGDRSYLVHDGLVAFVIDPQRDIDRVTYLAESLGVEIRHVFETHVHNDYVTGGLALATVCGAAYHVNAADPVTFDRTPIVDGQVVEVSRSLSVRAIATPGHTFSHLSYGLVTDAGPVGVFTGGSLLYGSTGRPDLMGAEHTGVLVRAQHQSARRLVTELPDGADIFPTHGFGSFCSAAQTDGTSSTIGQEKRHNPALVLDEDRFVADLLAGLDAFPAYYSHMGPANLSAPGDGPDLSLPVPADAAELRRRIDSGEWVVDLRDRASFSAGHVVGTLNFGLNGQFATYLGWMIPWGTPLTLLGDSTDQVAEAQRELVRIGIDRPAAASIGAPQHWSGSEPLATIQRRSYADLAAVRRSRDLVVLDVRRRLEWNDAHIAGAVHLPLHELPSRLHEVPDGEVWVHCAGGYRASLAASLLSAHGRTVIAVDDSFGKAAGTGLELETGEKAAA